MQINTSIFDTFPVLETKRLILRQFTEEDAKTIFQMRSDGRVNQFIARPGLHKLEQAQGLVNDTLRAYQERRAIGWAGIAKKNNDFIGSCGFNAIDFPNLRAEIGGELCVDYWGKNVAREAFEKIIHFGFHVMNLQSIEAKTSPQNKSAAFILESAGFVKEAHFRNRIYFNGQFQDMVVYTLWHPHLRHKV
jgi:[ribosomal protein S5]-alanine N-acetyltransferase